MLHSGKKWCECTRVYICTYIHTNAPNLILGFETLYNEIVTYAYKTVCLSIPSNGALLMIFKTF